MEEVVPAIGGRITAHQDGEAVGKGNPPEEVSNMLLKYGNNGIVIDGIIAWVMVNKEMTAEGINRQLLERSMGKNEILKSRLALKAAGGSYLEEIYPEINTKRTSPEWAITDIVTAIRMLSDKDKMPLVLASPDQMRRCPPAGSSPASVPEIQNQMKSLENTMEEFMKTSKKQMEDLVQEVRKSSKKTLVTPKSSGKTPGVEEPAICSRGMDTRVEATNPLFSEVVGLHPPGRTQPSSQPLNQEMLQNAFGDAFKTKEKAKPKSRNIFRGNSPEDSSLSADVDLVATGVAKDADEEKLKEFLKNRGIDVLKVECLTKAELVLENKVRSKTMKVTVKASDLEKAMKPEVWPSRVGVRHYRAPQRPIQREGEGSWASQSARAGGRMEDRGQGRKHPPRTPSIRQQQINQPALKVMLENMFGLLGEQVCP